MSVKDHLGYQYNTVIEMLKHYGIKKITYYHRLDRGWSLKETLETPTIQSRKGLKNITKVREDHLGNQFKSTEQMCKHYNVNRNTFESRIQLGMSLKSALTYDNKPRDHLGNKYNNLQEMLGKYGISKPTYYARIKRGWSLKRTLEVRQKNR